VRIFQSKAKEEIGFLKLKNNLELIRFLQGWGGFSVKTLETFI
jgi:hypothetical protein